MLAPDCQPLICPGPPTPIVDCIADHAVAVRVRARRSRAIRPHGQTFPYTPWTFIAPSLPPPSFNWCSTAWRYSEVRIQSIHPPSLSLYTHTTCSFHLFLFFQEGKGRYLRVWTGNVSSEGHHSTYCSPNILSRWWLLTFVLHREAPKTSIQVLINKRHTICGKSTDSGNITFIPL